ncbi:MAG: ABC transporter substrate-binding protein [Rhodobacteraceae bacterium]|nr:ABC transporter substrate-binding protein [Paracoccaceae bacterium]
MSTVSPKIGRSLSVSLLAIATSIASLSATQLAAENTMIVAAPFGPKSSIPDPRARQNGWLSNRAGVSETLIGLGYDMSMQPRLAVSYENLSPTEWKLTLRDGVTFHDGTPVTAQSVKDSFAKLDVEGHAAHNPRLSKLLGIADIQTPDDKTLIFTTKAPNSAFLWSLTEPSAAVMKEGTDALPLIGTGPFVFVKAEAEKSYEVKGFADYWGGAPKLDKLKIDAISDPSVAALALQAGDVDLVTHYPEPDFAKLKENGEGQLFAGATTRLFFFQPNMTTGPLANPALREAVSLGLDRETIVAASLVGVGGSPANTLFPANMASWSNAELSLPYDPVKAAEVLDAAGIKDTDGNGIRELDGKDVVLKLRSYEGRAALRPTLEISQVLLQQIGLGAEIAMGEFGANNDALKAGEIDLHLQAWGTAPQGDPDYFPSTLVATGASYNVSGYSNPELDALLEKGRSLFTTEERQPIYAEVQEIINRDLPVIPVFHKTQVSVGNGKVEGYQIHPAETYFASPELAIAK